MTCAPRWQLVGCVYPRALPDEEENQNGLLPTSTGFHRTAALEIQLLRIINRTGMLILLFISINSALCRRA